MHQVGEMEPVEIVFITQWNAARNRRPICGHCSSGKTAICSMDKEPIGLKCRWRYSAAIYKVRFLERVPIGTTWTRIYKGVTEPPRISPIW